MRSGIDLIEDSPGSGQPIARQQWYRVRLQMWLNKGDPIRWQKPWGTWPADLENDGTTLVTNVRWDRENLIDGIFYGCEDMRVGGERKIRIAPRLAYREPGVPGVIPENALLVVLVAILESLPNGP